MVDHLTARHLSAITREAAARAYESDSATGGKLATWLATILTTLHAGGLLAAIQYEDKLARPYEAQVSLLVGLIATLAGGIVAMIHYNALADRWRHEMHMEIEGVKEIGDAAKEFEAIANWADYAASGLVAVSILALALAGIFAI